MGFATIISKMNLKNKLGCDININFSRFFVFLTEDTGWYFLILNIFMLLLLVLRYLIGIKQWFSTQTASRPVFFIYFFHDPQFRTFRSISLNLVT